MNNVLIFRGFIKIMKKLNLNFFETNELNVTNDFDEFDKFIECGEFDKFLEINEFDGFNEFDEIDKFKKNNELINK